MACFTAGEWKAQPVWVSMSRIEDDGKHSDTCIEMGDPSPFPLNLGWAVFALTEGIEWNGC